MYLADKRVRNVTVFTELSVQFAYDYRAQIASRLRTTCLLSIQIESSMPAERST